MKRILPLLSLISFTVLLAGCAPQAGTIPSPEEVATRKVKVTPEEAKEYCQQKGGRYEWWKNDDGTSEVFCVLPGGYGCDPFKFADGSCGRE